MSYANIILYSATLPVYDTQKEDAKNVGKSETINASDPKNAELVNRLITM